MAYIAGYTEGDILVGGETYESFPRLELPIWENWDSTKLYKIGDKVYNEITGSSYVCIKDLEVVNTSTLDIIYWQLIVQGNTENAYEVWLLNGNIGTIEDFFLSIKGEKGEEGYTPQKGIDYFDGIDGINGTNGIDGTNGTNGVDGEQGIQGIQGPPVPIVNNLLEIVSGKALDATQGKIINDSLMSHLSAYTTLEGEVNNKVNKNLLVGRIEISNTYFDCSNISVNVATNTLTINAHGLNNGDLVGISLRFKEAGKIPLHGLPSGTRLFVVNKTDNTIQLSASLGGTPVVFTTTGSTTFGDWILDKPSVVSMLMAGLNKKKYYVIFYGNLITYANVAVGVSGNRSGSNMLGLGYAGATERPDYIMITGIMKIQNKTLSFEHVGSSVCATLSGGIVAPSKTWAGTTIATSNVSYDNNDIIKSITIINNIQTGAVPFGHGTVLEVYEIE